MRLTTAGTANYSQKYGRIREISLRTLISILAFARPKRTAVGESSGKLNNQHPAARIPTPIDTGHFAPRWSRVVPATKLVTECV
jgi:hypothetical protein